MPDFHSGTDVMYNEIVSGSVSRINFNTESVVGGVKCGAKHNGPNIVRVRFLCIDGVRILMKVIRSMFCFCYKNVFSASKKPYRTRF
jgi:hypothetical protein